MSRCQGKVALIAGGTSEVGLAAARRLLAEGARVVITDPVADTADAAARSLGAGASGYALDTSDERRWSVVAEEMLRAHAGWNVLVNIADEHCVGSVESISLAEWEKSARFNISATWRGCKAGVSYFKKAGGSIVNVTSVAGIVAGPDRCAFDAAGGAIRLLTKSIALHCLDKNYRVRCNSVHQDLPRAQEDWSGFTETSRGTSLPVTADDIAHMVVYLASDESSAITGAEMLVDGGRSAR